MKKLMLSMTAAVAVAVCSAGESEQERSWPWSPVGVGIAAPLQIPWTDSDVLGLRFGGFFGLNYRVYGLDLGLVEMAQENFFGLQLSGFS